MLNKKADDVKVICSACRKSPRKDFYTLVDCEKWCCISFSCEWVLYDGTAPKQKTKNAEQR